MPNGLEMRSPGQLCLSVLRWNAGWNSDNRSKENVSLAVRSSCAVVQDKDFRVYTVCGDAHASVRIDALSAFFGGRRLISPLTVQCQSHVSVIASLFPARDLQVVCPRIGLLITGIITQNKMLRPTRVISVGHARPRPSMQAVTCRSRRNLRVSAGLIDALKPITTAGMQPDLKSGIANFYDESSGLVRQGLGFELNCGRGHVIQVFTTACKCAVKVCHQYRSQPRSLFADSLPGGL